jgi:hypothetical protein
MSFWTSRSRDVIENIMRAELIVRKRQNLTDEAFIEMVAWKVPVPVPGSGHDVKYRLALMSDAICVLRYDNERGKGDHKHVGDSETLIASSISRR